MPWTSICAWGPTLSPAPCSTLPSSSFSFSSSPHPAGPCILHLLPRPLLTCSPARYLAARPWWTAPSGSTGPRSLVGPSAGGSHTTATDEEAVAGPLPWATQGWRVASQPGGPKRPRRGWGTGQRVGTTEISRKIQQWLLTISIQTLVVRASSRSFWGTEDRAKFPYLPSPAPWCPSSARPPPQLTREMRLVRVSFRLTLTISESCSAGRRWGL